MLQEIDSLISRDFDEIHQNVKDIVRNSTNTDQAVQDIVNYVSGKLTASCKGYAALLYSVKSKATLQEKIFESDENANRFYDLNLRQKLADAYQFNVSDLSSSKDRRDCKEVKERFGPTAVKAAAVSGALAAAMLGMLAIPTHIPLVVVIAGALIAGLGGGYYANKISVPQQNKSQFEKTVQEVIDKQESEVRRWADGLERYYDDQVGKLRKELEASANA